VQLVGFRSNIKEYYQAFDLFVCPSRREPLGRVVLEALDAGAPVVATATDGPTELLERHGGDLVPVGDVAALATQLQRHCQARTARRAHDLSAYHIDTVAHQTLEAYERLIVIRKQARLVALS
jgi:glycosyltransferase involved in cell wall biosynthesis